MDFSPLIAPLEEAVAQVDLAELPVLLGELERLKAVLWGRMMAVSSSNRSDQKGPAPTLLTIPQVAQRLAIPGGLAYELARQGTLPTVKVGKYVRVEPAVLEVWIAGHRHGRFDTELYTVYSTPRHDGKGTAKTAEAARPDPSRPGGRARGHGEHRGAVGARRGANSGADGSDDPSAAGI